MAIKKCFPVQKILFGPPGSGKSFRAREIGVELKAGTDCIIETTLHPAYDYGDFVVKLLPMTVRRTRQFNIEGILADQTYKVNTPEAESIIEYRAHAGHLIRTVAKALQVGPEKNVILIIDEINRGDCARIFGDILQLLDRDSSGWSKYGVNLSDLAFFGLMKELGWISEDSGTGTKWRKDQNTLVDGEIPKDIWSGLAEKNDEIKSIFSRIPVLRFPPNLSIVGTMNTSDESVYYMDTAFKRRWSFEFLNWNYGAEKYLDIKAQRDAKLGLTNYRWEDFLKNINNFIANSLMHRNIDDKQIGLWFIVADISEIYFAFQKAKDIRSPLVSDWEEIGLSGAPGDYKNKIITWSQGLDKYLEKLFKENNCIYAYEKLLLNYEDDRIKNPCPKLAAINVANLEESCWPIIISAAAIKCKLMHFLWDNVFSRDREPLERLIFENNQDRLRTFNDFVLQYERFVQAVMKEVSTPVAGSSESLRNDNF